MPTFIVNSNAQPDTHDHEVHNTTTGCTHMPNRENQVDLGTHPDCRSAVADAKRRWPSERINGCFYCANACHTS